MNVAQNPAVQSLFPGVRYNDPKAAIAWLTSVLGFEEHVAYADDAGNIVHAELKIAGNLLMLGGVKDDPYGKSPAALGGVSGSVYIAFDTPAEIDARYAPRASRQCGDRARNLRHRLWVARLCGARSRGPRLELRNVPSPRRPVTAQTTAPREPSRRAMLYPHADDPKSSQANR